MVCYLDTTEKLRAAETSKYTESASIEVYTKAEPNEGTYITYVYLELKFYDYDKPLPGMSTFYVCTKEYGSFYINKDYELSEGERRYMREMQLQDDVIDLNNKIAADYNDVRIRSGASETSNKLATAYTSEKLDVIMKQTDGWTKIKYKGKTAYVKSKRPPNHYSLEVNSLLSL